MIGLDRRRQQLAAALAGLAGYVDATGFLWADRHYVSFMSGNTTRLASEVITAPSRAVPAALLIAGFVTGVAIGHMVALVEGPWRKPAVLSLVTVLLANAWLAALQSRQGTGMAAMVLAMGALNNVFQRDERPIGLTYLTGALVQIGQGLAHSVLRRPGPSVRPFVAQWLALAAGAALGAACHGVLDSGTLALPVIGSALLTGCAFRLVSAPAKP